MSMLFRRISFLLFSLFLLPAAHAAAEPSTSTSDSKKEKPVKAGDEESPPDSGPKIVTLHDCLKMSKKNHPAVMAAKFKLIALRKQLSEAHWAPFFNIGMTTLLAPTSTMKGNAIAAEGGDLGDYSSLGIWVRLEVQAGFPIFTFGKIKSYWKMAEEGVAIGKMELQKQVNEIDFEVRRAYLTAVFARQMKSVLQEGKDYLDEARDKIEEDLENEEGESTLSDQLKVKAYTAQLESQLIQIKQVEEVAMAGLRFLTGDDNIAVKDEVIELEEGSLKKLSYYIEETKKNRPELAILDSAVKVSKAQVKLNKSKYLPDFLLVGKYTFAYANKVDPQDTPFASDPYNTNSGGVALLMQYPFDFVPNYYRTDKAKAQLLQMQAQQEAATGAFFLEVEKAYGEARSRYDAVKSLKKGKKAAKGWIVATHQNYQAGLADLKDFTDALVTYFMLTGDYYKAIYDYNVALSSLRLATGSTKLW
jgi:outer membrane protein TolC